MILFELRQTRNSMRYGFAWGKLAVLGSRALDSQAVERLLDARDFDERARLLSDTPYGRHLDGACTPEKIEQALSDALEASYRFLSESQLDETIQHYFRMRYDYENIRALLKARLLGIEPAGLFGDHGRFAVEALLEHHTTLPQDVRELLHWEAPTVAEIDQRIDEGFFAERLAVAHKAKTPYLVALAKLDIDLANAKILLRSGYQGASFDTLAPKLIVGGEVAHKTLMGVYQGSIGQGLGVTELATRLVGLRTFRLLAVEDLLDAHTLDLALNAYLGDQVHKGARLPVGPEPIIAYVGRTETEVALLRVILLGVASGIDPKSLRKYVKVLRK